jgi:hypothetical protein
LVVAGSWRVVVLLQLIAIIGVAECNVVVELRVCCVEKPEKETILGKTSGFDSAKGTTYWVTTRFHVCKHHHRVEKKTRQMLHPAYN